MCDRSNNDAKDRQLPARQTSPGAEPLTHFFARAGLGDIDIQRVKAAARDEGEFTE